MAVAVGSSSRSRITLLLLVDILFLHFLCHVQVACAFYISPPANDNDWRQLASLVTQTFDAPSSKDENVATMMDQLEWNLVERHLTEHFNYRHHVQTARRMVGLKYSILLAKEGSQVVGVVEVGIKQQQQQQQQKQDLENEAMKTTCPTIGSLCVDPNYRRRGIARGLVERCETLVQNTWNEKVICAEVQVANTQAREFFQACGYFAKQPAEQVVMVAVQQRRRLETRPHVILSKELLLPPLDDDDRGTAVNADANRKSSNSGEASVSGKQWMW